MHRSTVFALVFATVSLAACAGGPDPDQGTTTGSGSAAKEPTAASETNEPAGSEEAEPSVGPECTKYFACCDEIAKAQPALAGSCDSTRKAVADATEKGASTASYESACKQALASMKGAGYCN